MDYDLAQKAISEALGGFWEKAVKTNNEILKKFPDDPETLNRLAKAYFELGNIKKAKTICSKIIKSDPLNIIATRNLDKWKSVKNCLKSSLKPLQFISFIEEPGKTKLVSLLNLGDFRAVSKLNAGDEVNLNTHTHSVSVTTTEGRYIGKLPDDLAMRLKKLINCGNTYKTFVKSIDSKAVKVFIKEEKRSKKFKNTSSFPLKIPEEASAPIPEPGQNSL